MRISMMMAAALALPGIAAAQDGSLWERRDDRPANFDRAVGPDAMEWPLSAKIEYLMAKYRLEAAPSAPTEEVYTVSYGWKGGNAPYSSFFTQANSRESPVFRPDARFPGDCTALIERETGKILTSDVRAALGIALRPVVAAGGYAVPMYDFPGRSAMFPAYVLVGGGPLWQEEEREGQRNYISPLEDGQTIDSPFFPLDNGSPTTSSWLSEFLPIVEYRTDKGVCRKNNYGIEVFIPIILGAPGVKATPATVAAPKPAAPSKPAPKGRGPALTVTSPPPPKPPAPEAIVYKPSGERPKPPEAPKLPPCPPGPTACVVADGGPMSPEGLAYMEKARAYEIAIREFEAKEAAERQAVADLNKQKQQEYSANLAAIEKERTNALAARDAKIAADKAAYNAALKAHQDESTRLAREHEAAMAEWRRKTAACLAGDMSQCANSGDK